MKYYIDTEFRETPCTIDLISIAVVAGSGYSYYAISNEFDLDKAWNDEWLRTNVLVSINNDLWKKYKTEMGNDHVIRSNRFWKFSKGNLRRLLRRYGSTREAIANELKAFIYTEAGLFPNSSQNFEHLIKDMPIEFYAYYADYDWVVFCWLFGRMIDLPKGFPWYCKDLKQIMDEKGYDQEWKKVHCPDPKGEHNALVDAKWNMEFHKALLEDK